MRLAGIRTGFMTLCFVIDPLQVGGYVVEFDVRDPGTFILQLGINWYFGATEPGQLPLPICVGGHMSDAYRESDLMRSFVHGGEVIKVTLDAADAKPTVDMPQFGAAKCRGGDEKGRWLNLGDASSNPCKPPYCTGNRSETVNGLEPVREHVVSRHSCVMYTLHCDFACAARRRSG